MSVWDEIIGGGEPYVAVRLKDVGGLVKSQGGATGALAFKFAPNTISAKVYDELSKQLADGLTQKGVSADVSVQTSAGGPAPKGDLFRGAILGAVGVGVGWAAWHYVLRGLIKGKR